MYFCYNLHLCPLPLWIEIAYLLSKITLLRCSFVFQNVGLFVKKNNTSASKERVEGICIKYFMELHNISLLLSVLGCLCRRYDKRGAVPIFFVGIHLNTSRG